MEKSSDAVLSEWRRMLRHFNVIDHEPWPESLNHLNWKKTLHTWIEENVDDICEQRPMHQMVSDW